MSKKIIYTLLLNDMRGLKLVDKGTLSSEPIAIPLNNNFFLLNKLIEEGNSDLINNIRIVIGDIGLNVFLKNYILLSEYRDYLSGELLEYQNLELVEHKAYVRSFLDSLWLVKDNAVNFSQILSVVKDGEDNFNLLLKNNIIYSKSNGEMDDVSLSIDEINTANKWFKLLYEKAKVELDDVNINNLVKNNYYNLDKYKRPNNNSRFNDALTFLIKARADAYIPSKISYYIFVLESLFTNSSESISKQIRLRVAEFITRYSEAQKSKVEKL